MTQKGRGLFLGKPVGVPTGISIGKPGLLIFKGRDIVARESFIVDLTSLDLDLTTLQVQFHG